MWAWQVRATRDYLNDKRPKRPLVFLPNALSVRGRAAGRKESLVLQGGARKET